MITYPMRIRDGGTSMIITVPKHVHDAGYTAGTLVNVTLEKIDQSGAAPRINKIPSVITAAPENKKGEKHG